MERKKRIIDERGRLFGKLSVIDLAVVVIVIAMAVAYYVKTNSGAETRTTSMTDVTYNLTIREVRQGTVDLVRPGDKVYDEHGVNLGEVTGLTVAPAAIKSTLVDGSYVNAGSEGKFDLTLTLVVGCAIADGHIYADRKTELTVGGVIPVVTKYVKTSAHVTDILN
ncbi:MAG: DUF4330 domain-containing protein [Oscillospiraceae bacterium]|jgi:hypothetical protein|nr:DUF4330 domain-containing protein [Oscillospiraceae bacterium]